MKALETHYAARLYEMNLDTTITKKRKPLLVFFSPNFFSVELAEN